MDCMAICAPNLSQESSLFALIKLNSWRDEKRVLMNQRSENFIKVFKNENKSGFKINNIGPYFAYL